MKYNIFIGFVFLSFVAFSQINDGQLLENSRPGVKIIPFNDIYYLIDADAEIARANKKQAKEVSTIFRYGITNNIASRVITSYDTYNILTDTTVQSRDDLTRIYSSVIYKYQKPVDISQPDTAAGEIYKPDIFGLGSKESNPKNKNIKNKDADNKEYMNALVKDASLFSYLQNKYKVNL
ncbi:MAG: hypothetical protein ACK4IY_10290, partial [Chitinophagales bacterium]